MPRVSIVLPSFNGERWLHESIDSVINQTYKDWELIIVDDCSSDSTFDIAYKYSIHDTRIRVIHNEENKKLPGALNVGFRVAAGEYLTWTSDDNMYESTAIDKMVKYLDDNIDKPMVCAAMKDVDEEGNLISERRTYSDELMYYNDYVGACFMYRKAVLDEVGEYDESLFCVEDYDYWFRILLKYGSIGYIDEILYIDRLHGQSLSLAKWDYVRKQLTRMRIKNIDIITEKLANRSDLLTAIFFESISYGEDNEKLKSLLLRTVDVLNIVNHKGEKEEKSYIVYGAGNMGSKAHEYLGDKMTCFADGDSEKVGKMKENAFIISVDEMINKKDEYDIVVAVAYKNVYELLCVLKEKGVSHCYVFISDINGSCYLYG